MTVMLLRPVEPQTDNGDDGEIHLYCCRPGRALCGVRIDGDIVDDSEEADECVACASLDVMGVGCSALFCGLRRAWRRWRS